MSFFERLKAAISFLFGGELPRPALPPPAPVAEKPAPTPEQQHASALFLLSLLQREGRLLDFLQEDVSGFSDADVGAAARVVHDGCAKALKGWLALKPVVMQSEGDNVEVPRGFDANRYRLTGNVTGEGPWKGTLKHHGWEAQHVTLPSVPQTIDLRVVAPAELELP